MVILKHKKFDPLPHFLVWGILLSLSVIMFSYKTAQESQDIRGRAEEDPGFCQDKCIGQDRCGNGPLGDPAYNHPCCEELQKTGDPFACGYPERLYCLPGQCAGIPEGVPRQRCGGSRIAWCEKCIAAGCPGYGSAPQPTTSLPPPPTTTVYIPPPTFTPIPIPPTVIPLPTTNYPASPAGGQPPTSIPPAYITVVIQPTIIVLPTLPSAPIWTPSPTPKKITLPQILPPREKVTAFFDRLKTQLMSFLTNILP